MDFVMDLLIPKEIQPNPGTQNGVFRYNIYCFFRNEQVLSWDNSSDSLCQKLTINARDPVWKKSANYEKIRDLNAERFWVKIIFIQNLLKI